VMGHVNPASTYWYLTAVPELMTPVADRLEAAFGGQR
jgi:integrase/recombinase XerD